MKSVTITESDLNKLLADVDVVRQHLELDEIAEAESKLLI